MKTNECVGVISIENVIKYINNEGIVENVLRFWRDIGVNSTLLIPLNSLTHLFLQDKNCPKSDNLLCTFGECTKKAARLRGFWIN